MKAIQKSFLSLAATLLLATPGLASDIGLSAGTDNITLTNNLTQAVYVAALVSDTDYIALNVQLGAGKARKVKFSGPVPAPLRAHVFPVGKKPLDGFTPSPQGFYELTVSVQ